MKEYGIQDLAGRYHGAGRHSGRPLHGGIDRLATTRKPLHNLYHRAGRHSGRPLRPLRGNGVRVGHDGVSEGIRPGYDRAYLGRIASRRRSISVRSSSRSVRSGEVTDASVMMPRSARTVLMKPSMAALREPLVIVPTIASMRAISSLTEAARSKSPEAAV